jgi:muconate cycloisomerase
VPVHTLLGGAFRKSVDVTWALGAAPAEEIIEEALDLVESKRHFSFKLKMGALDPAVDTARVVQIAQALQGKAGVRIDVNARWDRLTHRAEVRAPPRRRRRRTDRAAHTR